MTMIGDNVSKSEAFLLVEELAPVSADSVPTLKFTVKGQMLECNAGWLFAGKVKDKGTKTVQAYKTLFPKIVMGN